MNLRDMYYISVIDEEKSISKAAARLFVSQPSLSQCLQKIEKQIGSAVFIRTSNGVVLTNEGRVFIDFIHKCLEEKKEFEKKLKDLQSQDGGEVRIGFTGTQAAYVLPYFLPQFKKENPNISIILVEQSSDVIEKKLITGEVDVGIIHPPIGVEGLLSFELSHDELVVIPRRNSQYQKYIYYQDGDDKPYIHLAFLKNEPIALSSVGQRSRAICDQVFLQAGITPQIRQISHSLLALDAMAQVDYATVILPQKQLSSQLLRKPYFYMNAKYAGEYPFLVAVRQNVYLSFAAKKLVKLLRSLCGSF